MHAFFLPCFWRQGLLGLTLLPNLARLAGCRLSTDCLCWSVTWVQPGCSASANAVRVRASACASWRLLLPLTSVRSACLSFLRKCCHPPPGQNTPRNKAQAGGLAQTGRGYLRGRSSAGQACNSASRRALLKLKLSAFTPPRDYRQRLSMHPTLDSDSISCGYVGCRVRLMQQHCRYAHGWANSNA